MKPSPSKAMISKKTIPEVTEQGVYFFRNDDQELFLAWIPDPDAFEIPRLLKIDKKNAIPIRSIGVGEYFGPLTFGRSP